MIGFLLEIPLKRSLHSVKDLFKRAPGNCQFFSSSNYEIAIWGDAVNLKEYIEGLRGSTPDVKQLLTQLYGHFYFIIYDKDKDEVNIGNSIFSILPVYYLQNGDCLLMSENALRIASYTGLKNISLRFILETMLFNYPLFNNSIIDGIKLIPSNSYFSIKRGSNLIIKHTSIENHFVSAPKPWRKTAGYLTDLFLETTSNYLPEKPFLCSLTGGLDGRTLTAASIYLKRDVSCYCFGSSKSADMEIAEYLTNYSGIPFFPINLDSEYVEKSSQKCGEEFIINASGSATFARGHYLFAAKKIAAKNNIIVTGNFGSEIFRAAHIPGAVISQNLYHLFNAQTPEKAFELIEKGPQFVLLDNRKIFKEWEELKHDLRHSPRFNPAYSDLSLNQKFYIMIFEEVFRKYFGAEMINQFGHIINRTPYLDFGFVKEILKSGFAGIHSDFFESRPIKRYKGQVLYAYIIKKAFPLFGALNTDKGYKPDDLTGLFSKINVLRGYLKKRKRHNSELYDPNSVYKAWKANHDNWERRSVPADIYNREVMFKLTDQLARDDWFKIHSISYVYSKIMRDDY